MIPDENMLIVHEIGDLWFIEKTPHRIYIATTASKGYMTFSYWGPIEEDDYMYFETFDQAKENVQKRYKVLEEMQKIR